jgi:hypothetical protein
VIRGVRCQDLVYHFPRSQILEQPRCTDEAGEGVAVVTPFEAGLTRERREEVDAESEGLHSLRIDDAHS